jgi:hypothetical protein
MKKMSFIAVTIATSAISTPLQIHALENGVAANLLGVSPGDCREIPCGETGSAFRA